MYDNEYNNDFLRNELYIIAPSRNHVDSAIVDPLSDSARSSGSGALIIQAGSASSGNRETVEWNGSGGGLGQWHSADWKTLA